MCAACHICSIFTLVCLLHFATQLHIDCYFILFYRVALVMMDLLAVLVFLELR